MTSWVYSWRFCMRWAYPPGGWAYPPRGWGPPSRDWPIHLSALTSRVGRIVPPLLAVMATSVPGHAPRSHCAPVWYGCCTSIKTGEGALPPPPGVVQQCERPCGLPTPMAVSPASSARIPAPHSWKPSVQLSFCERVRENLRNFSMEEKRLALAARNITVVWHPEKDPEITGSIPLGIGHSTPGCAANLARH